MKTRPFALATILALAACSSGSEVPAPNAPAGATEQQLRAFDALQRTTGRPWSWSQEDGKAPMHLAAARFGAPTLKAGMGVEEATKAFLAAHKELFRMRDPSAELRLVRSEVDTIAMTHARFQQHVRGVPVVGADLVAHYDGNGLLTSLDAMYVPDLEGVDVDPKLDSQSVTAAVKDDVARFMRLADPSVLAANDGKLVVFALGDRDPKLAYEVTVRAVFGDEPAIWVTTVDANTGDILDRYNNLQTIEGSGAGVLGDTKTIQVTAQAGGFALVDTSRGVQISTHTARGQQITAEQGASIVTSTSASSWDTQSPGPGAAVDAHFNAGAVYDYYKRVHNRNGIDGAGGDMLSAVHFGQAYDNAFWDGSSMSYGDGGRLFKPLSAGLDVCAHEFTHGITQQTSALRYQGQAGALNEALSDIFAAFIEHAVKPDAVNNWRMGELIGKQPGSLRDMKNPAAAQQPDHMSKFVQTQQDNGGVHINSGIINNAAYLMTMGGANPTSGKGPQFGVGWEKAEKLWYRTNTNYLTSTSNFAAAAQATIQAAKDLSFTDNEQNIVDCAWKAVGVVQGTCAAIVDPQSTIPTTPGGAAEPGETSSSSGGATEATPGQGGPSEAPVGRKRRLVTEETGGCSASPRRELDVGPLVGLFAAVLGLRIGRRRRR